MKQKLKSIINLITKFTPLALFAVLGLALAAPQTAQGDDTAVGQYVRFTITQRKVVPTTGFSDVRLSEFALYDKDKNRLNTGLTALGTKGKSTS